MGLVATKAVAQAQAYADEHAYDLAIELTRSAADSAPPYPTLNHLAHLLAPVGGTHSLARKFAEDAILRAFVKDRQPKT